MEKVKNLDDRFEENRQEKLYIKTMPMDEKRKKFAMVVNKRYRELEAESRSPEKLGKAVTAIRERIRLSAIELRNKGIYIDMEEHPLTLSDLHKELHLLAKRGKALEKYFHGKEKCLLSLERRAAAAKLILAECKAASLAGIKPDGGL